MSDGMSEQRVDADHVRREHLAAVDERRHWVYLLAVLVGGTLLMLMLIAAVASVSS